MGGTRWVLRPKLTFASHRPRPRRTRRYMHTSHPTHQSLGLDGCGPSVVHVVNDDKATWHMQLLCNYRASQTRGTSPVSATTVQANVTRVPRTCISAPHTSIFRTVMHPMLPSLPEMNRMLRVRAGAKCSHHNLSYVDECLQVGQHHARRSVLCSHHC